MITRAALLPFLTCLLLVLSHCRNNPPAIPERQAEPSVKPTQTTNIPKGIDAEVWDIYQYIKKNGEAPEGYVGGRIFQNREKKLPITTSSGKKIKYQEWDVHPKIKGKNRGTDRLVTGSDGTAWYTDNHYKSFKQIE